MEQVKFFCDEHLGKLARWLRILGVDAAWQNRISDEELLTKAATEGRVVLTRDTHLASQTVEIALLRENYPALQLREVVGRFREGIRIRVFSRCPVCNREVEPASAQAIQDRAPPFVRTTQTQFTACPECGRVFWKATHHERVELSLRDVLGELYAGEEEQ